MRYLGIDHGEKRIGLAISDENGKIAFPYAVAESFKEVLAAVKKEGVSKIIVGTPVAFSGRESRQAIEVRKFADRLLKKVKLPIEFENEVLTTRIAEDGGSSGAAVDASAAALILQSYLDRENRK